MSEELSRIQKASSKFEDHHINYAYIVAPRTVDARLSALDQEIERVEHVLLTDAITHMEYGGALVLETLAKEQVHKNIRWKIRVVKDEWGNAPKPGDVVTRRIQRKLVDRAGRKLRSNAVNAMKRQGGFEKRYIDKREFVVDDKGCIDCGYEDAAWLLSTHGIHYKTNEGLGGHREHSTSPKEAPNGQMLHRHHWRYSEAPPWVYNELPTLDSTEPKKKRGHTPDPDDKPHADKAAAVD